MSSTLYEEIDAPHWDLESKPFIDNSNSSYEWMEIKDPNVPSTANVDPSAQLVFRVPVSNSWIDLKTSYLSCNMIVHKNNANNRVGLSLNAFNCFETWRLYIGDKLVEEVRHCGEVVELMSQVLEFNHKAQQTGLYLSEKLVQQSQGRERLSGTIVGNLELPSVSGISDTFVEGWVKKMLKIGDIGINDVNLPLSFPLHVLFKSVKELPALIGLPIEVRVSLRLSATTDILAGPPETATIADVLAGFVPGITGTGANPELSTLNMNTFSLWVSKAQPSIRMREKLADFIVKKDPLAIRWQGISAFQTNGEANKSWRITSVHSRPMYCFVFQRVNLAAAAADQFPQIRTFIRGNWTNMHLRYNNVSVPEVGYKDLGGIGDIRAYQALQKAADFFGSQEAFNISFEDFRTNYYIMTFDMSYLDPDVFKSGDASLVLETTGDSTGNTIYAVLLTERELILQGLGSATEALSIVSLQGL